MTDLSGQGLGHGQFGECTYDTDNKEWHWAQELQSASYYHHVGPSSIAIPAQEDAPQNAPARTSQAGRVLDLIRGTPSFGPARDMLDDLVPSSSQVPEHEPVASAQQRGDCFAIGKIYDHLYRKTRNTVVAFPADASGRLLRLVEVRRQRQGWQKDKSIWLNVPTIQGESGSWDAKSPIQQICFSNADEDPYCHLAVRTLKSTFILRPRLRDHTLRPGDTSRLEFVVLVAIPFDGQQDSPHLDVCFNPWYTPQFATVDESGVWSIWDTGGSREPGRLVKLTQTYCGAFDDGNRSERPKAVTGDKFRICWIGTVSTVLICAENAISIVDIGSKLPSVLKSGIEIDGHDGVILDVQQDPVNPGRILLLTNAHVFYLSMGSGGSRASLEVLLKVKHFRDFADETLRLAVFARGDKTVISIRSTKSPIISIQEIDATHMPCSISSATVWRVPSAPTDTVSTIRILPIEFEEKERRVAVNGPGHQFNELGIEFWQAFSLLRSNSIRAQMLCSATSFHLCQIVASPEWRGKTAASSARAERSVFVVEDETLDRLAGRHRLASATSLPYRHASAKNRTTNGQKLTVSYEPAYTCISDVQSDSAEDFSDLLKRVEAAVFKTTMFDSFPMQSLSAYLEQEVSVSDLHEAVEAMGSILDTNTLPGGEYHSQVVEVPGLTTLGFAREIASFTFLNDVYDSLVSQWLSPLNSLVAGRIRLAKEQLIRRIAAEISLASYCLRRPFVSDVQGQAQMELQQTSSQSKSSMLPSDDPPHSSLPTPSPSTSPSLHGHAAPEEPKTALDRLRLYAEIDEPVPLQAPSSSTLRILSHWDPQISPSSYDWAAIITAQQRTTEETLASAQLSERQRARLRRKSDKLAARTARENRAADTYAETLARAPTLLSSSQIPSQNVFSPVQTRDYPSQSQSLSQNPVPGTDRKRRRSAGFGNASSMPFRHPVSSPVRARNTASALSQGNNHASTQNQVLSQIPESSQTVDQSTGPSGPAVASQVEPGRFGGRSSLGGAPRRKKRRTEGF